MACCQLTCCEVLWARKQDWLLDGHLQCLPHCVPQKPANSCPRLGSALPGITTAMLCVCGFVTKCERIRSMTRMLGEGEEKGPQIQASSVVMENKFIFNLT